MLSDIGDYQEDIAKFANSWSVQTPDDATCVPTASDFPSPCSTDSESYEVSCLASLLFIYFYARPSAWAK